MQINYLTMMAMTSIKYNGHKSELAQSIDVKELKRKWAKIYYPTGDMPPGFIKGAKTINFEAILEFVKP